LSLHVPLLSVNDKRVSMTRGYPPMAMEYIGIQPAVRTWQIGGCIDFPVDEATGTAVQRR
jgi:hypothetical protein